MIDLGAAIVLGSFLLMFGSVLALFRIEYEAPTSLSVAVSAAAVLFGFLVTLSVSAAGIAALHEAAGGLATVLFAVATALALVG